MEAAAISMQDKKTNSNLKMLAVNSLKLAQQYEEMPVGSVIVVQQTCRLWWTQSSWDEGGKRLLQRVVPKTTDFQLP